MHDSGKTGAASFVIVSHRQAQQEPYPYVQVNDDGSVRELSASERSYLETPFSPGDGGRPALKGAYSSRNGWGSLRGFCRRSLIPAGIEIQPAEPPPPAPSQEAGS